MLKIRTLTLFLFAALLLGVGATARADREAERAREEAWESARKEFAKQFSSDDAAVRRKALYAIREYADLGAAELVLEKVLPSERNYGVLDAAVAVLSAPRDPEVVEDLAKEATGRGPWEVRARVVEALGSIPLNDSKEAIRKLLDREKDPRVLSMALFSAGELNMQDAFDLVLEHLEHDDWQVRVAAIETLADFKLEKAIVPLIDRLMNERGRLRQDLADALKAITGKDFGRDANLWRKWYHERGDEEPEPVKPEDPNAPATSKTDEPTYFGMKVISERVLFIIDVSLSMKTPIDIDKMKLAREAARTGPAEEDDKDAERFEDTINWWEIKDRLDLAKAQLKFVIKNLKKDQQFEVASFSNDVESWNGGRLVKATTRAKLKAIQFIDGLEVVEATAAGAALDWAFEMAGPGAGDRNYRAGVDTIFFLSDGAPSDRPEDEILEQVSGRNQLRKIRIHVVAIVNYSVRFLEQLAKRNGGIYKFIQVEDK